MELGEGLCKLRKMNFKSGPFYQFEQEISAALDFIYQTQIELAACGLISSPFKSHLFNFICLSPTQRHPKSISEFSLDTRLDLEICK